MVLVAPPLAEGSVGESGGNVKLLPYHQFEITSPMKRADALAAMASRVEPENWLRFFRWPSSANDARFEGTVGKDGFHVRRVIGYNNAFLPVIDGDVQSVGALTRIIVTMRLMYFVMVFGVFWFGIMFTAIFAIGGNAWFGLPMIAAFYLIAIAAFWYEATRQEATLKRIFQANES